MPFAPQQYNIMPIILKNCLAQEIKGNPKELARIIHELKPQANIKVIIVLPSGDLLIEGESPHDFSILRQEWPDTYGRITPQLPEDKSVNQRVLIYDLPLSIGEKEIKDALFDEDLHPKNVFRFNMKGSQEKSTTVLITFSSKEQKDKILANGFKCFFQKFTVVDYHEDPEVTQCFRCQNFGHNFRDCKAPKQKCLRCAGDHRHRACPNDKNDVTCANCGACHMASYKGCPVYKEAVRAKREKKA